MCSRLTSASATVQLNSNSRLTSASATVQLNSKKKKNATVQLNSKKKKIKNFIVW